MNDSTSAYIYNDDIRTALGLTPNDPEIDVDGLMVFDDLADGRFFTGDSILFSVSENQSARRAISWRRNLGVELRQSGNFFESWWRCVGYRQPTSFAVWLGRFAR